MQKTFSTFGTPPPPPRPPGFAQTLSRKKRRGFVVLGLVWPICCTLMGETPMGPVDTKLVSGRTLWGSVRYCQCAAVFERHHRDGAYAQR